MNNNIVKFQRSHPDAVIPTKGEPFAVGYDLTCISIYKKVGENTIIYNTHIHIQPPPGRYFMVAPRSSLAGYVMTNSIGIIDPTYRGPLLISLTRTDNSVPELKVPFKKFQLIPMMLMPDVEFQEKELEKTKRGSGGFGSTDK